MSDENGTNEQVKTFWQKTKDFAKKNSIMLGAVAVLLFIAKFSSLIVDLITWLSKRTVQKTKDQDVGLKKQEDAAKSAADALVKRADELPSTKKPVDEDWNKK